METAGRGRLRGLEHPYFAAVCLHVGTSLTALGESSKAMSTASTWVARNC